MTFCEDSSASSRSPPRAPDPAFPPAALSNCRGLQSRRLRGAGSPDLLDLADDRLIDSAVAPEANPAPVITAHDAADDGMDGDFSATAVVGRLWAGGKASSHRRWQPAFASSYFLLVEDFLQFVKAVVRCLILILKSPVFELVFLLFS